jgi:hypothetical protein
MNASPAEQLGKMVSRGLVEYIFEAEQSVSLIEACGSNQEFLVAHNFGELFGTIQSLAINQFVLSVTKIYEKPNTRYPNLSAPSLLVFLEENAEHLEVTEPILVKRGLGLLGIDSTEFENADSSAKRNMLLIHRLRERLPDIANDESLRALKALRDKKIAHPEDIDIDDLEKTTWEKAERLLFLSRGIVGLLGDAYLSTAYWDDEGTYLCSTDGSRVGRAMQRLIRAADK